MQKQATNNQPTKPKLSKSDVRLTFKLIAEDDKSEIANIDQTVVIPSLKEPMFLPDAYMQVEQMLGLIALEPFKRILTTYFNTLLKTHQEMTMPVVKDAKILVETANVEPESTLSDPLDQLDKEGITGDTSNVNPDEHYNLEVEEEEEQSKK